MLRSASMEGVNLTDKRRYVKIRPVSRKFCQMFKCYFFSIVHVFNLLSDNYYENV